MIGFFYARTAFGYLDPNTMYLIDPFFKSYGTRFEHIDAVCRRLAEILDCDVTPCHPDSLIGLAIIELNGRNRP